MLLLRFHRLLSRRNGSRDIRAGRLSRCDITGNRLQLMLCVCQLCW